MRPTNFLGTLVLVSALLPNCGEFALAAGGGKQVPVQPGGKSTDHVSERRSTNTNAQWSADPEKGWVRAEKRHELHEQSDTESNRKFQKAKRKGKND